VDYKRLLKLKRLHNEGVMVEEKKRKGKGKENVE
jgi:hypothetical protein